MWFWLKVKCAQFKLLHYRVIGRRLHLFDFSPLCVFKGLPKKMQSHIGCIWLGFNCRCCQCPQFKLLHYRFIGRPKTKLTFSFKTYSVSRIQQFFRIESMNDINSASSMMNHHIHAKYLQMKIFWSKVNLGSIGIGGRAS